MTAEPNAPQCPNCHRSLGDPPGMLCVECRAVANTIEEKPESWDDIMDGPCWCGCENPHYDDDLDETCGGSGVLYCHCGGDICVCHWHGEVQCQGCEDCEERDGEDWEDDDGR